MYHIVLSSTNRGGGCRVPMSCESVSAMTSCSFRWFWAGKVISNFCGSLTFNYGSSLLTGSAEQKYRKKTHSFWWLAMLSNFNAAVISRLKASQSNFVMCFIHYIAFLYRSALHKFRRMLVRENHYSVLHACENILYMEILCFFSFHRWKKVHFRSLPTWHCRTF